MKVLDSIDKLVPIHTVVNTSIMYSMALHQHIQE